MFAERGAVSDILIDGLRHAIRNGSHVDESLQFFRDYCEPYRVRIEEEGSEEEISLFSNMAVFVENEIRDRWNPEDKNKKNKLISLKDIKPIAYAFIAAIILVCILITIENYKNNNNNMSSYHEQTKTDQRGSG